MKIVYSDAQGQQSARTVWPVTMAYYVDVNLLGAWCELRRDFRHFRVELLRCVAGLAEPDAGSITLSRGGRIGYVEQDLPPALLRLPLQEAVRRALSPAEREHEAWRVGRRAWACWRCAWTSQPTMSIFPRQEQLEAELLAHGATCVLVSHDRPFVAAVGTRFLQIEGGQACEQFSTGRT